MVRRSNDVGTVAGRRDLRSRGQWPTMSVRVVQAVRALARASRVVERACGELNLAHYRVLSALASGDQRASRVAARLAPGKPTVGAGVDALCRRGRLTRSAEAGDQRAIALSLTGAGRWLLERVEDEMVATITGLSARRRTRRR
jgi:DNA-binding MarR family transcriptional regulator